MIVYNGEVYNFIDIRNELKALGHRFRGGSDTEVLLTAVDHWGIDEGIERFIGMFAFAIFDRKERRLHLVRDRIGIKPLYYGRVNGVFVFGSELKALRAHPSWKADIDRNAICQYLRHVYIPAPHSIYEGVYKLMPGTRLEVGPGGFLPDAFDPFSNEDGDGKNRPKPYWSLKRAFEAGLAEPFAGSDEEAVERLDSLLQDAVRRRMISDVPLGAFLSGGIDSSTIVALMQAQSPRPVKTFSIGFYEEGYNEAPHAKAVAEHLGTEHTELYVTTDEALNVIPKLPFLYDEPFSDSSQIPTYLVSAITRRDVTVALSGDGGDELFGGYTRYFIVNRLWKTIGWVPLPVRAYLGKVLNDLGDSGHSFFQAAVDRIYPTVRAHRPPSNRLKIAAEVMGFDALPELYQRAVSLWSNPAELLPDARESRSFFDDPARRIRGMTPVRWMMYADLQSYHPDDILVKVDRASMGVSLEARVPMIDHRVVEFAAGLPIRFNVRNGKSKWLLRQVLYRYVPKALIERPKMGFGVPIGRWLNGSLRDWAEDLLSESRLRRKGVFQVEPITEKWREHKDGVRNWEAYLWNILMFEAWSDASNV